MMVPLVPVTLSVHATRAACPRQRFTVFPKARGEEKHRMASGTRHTFRVCRSCRSRPAGNATKTSCAKRTGHEKLQHCCRFLLLPPW
uniref:Putative secreted protein n=1 Tax=Anopheles darlingi TaxID=43151 RepID=A0A2M4DBG1_ANODA